MNAETVHHIWRGLEDFAEENTRKQDDGYLQLYLIKQRSDQVLRDEDKAAISDAIDREKDKWYDEEDLVIYPYGRSSVAPWYRNISLRIRNEISGMDKPIPRKSVDAYGRESWCMMMLGLQHIACEAQRKEVMLRVRDLEKEYRRRRDEAYMFLEPELSMKDEEIQRLRRRVEQLEERLRESRRSDQGDE